MKRSGLPYVQGGDPAQVLDIYYADEAVHKDAVLVDIESDNKKVGHVHNVSNPNLPESQEVNAQMAAFLDRYLK